MLKVKINNKDNLRCNRMNIFRTEHNGTNYEAKINSYFGEGYARE